MLVDLQAASTVASTWPPRMMANEVALSKNTVPGTMPHGLPPAFTRSSIGSPSSRPMPRKPFSDCRVMLTSGER